MKDDRAVDRAARQLHEEAFAIIDCTQCARCCKTVSPIFRKADIARIVKRLGMTATEFRATYLQADEDGDLCLKSLPCTFLNDNGRCTIYDARPRDCAEYPHTHKRGFSGRTRLHAGNAIHCPAVFWIVEQLRTRHRWKP
jgi:uncharacterized protein